MTEGSSNFVALHDYWGQRAFFHFFVILGLSDYYHISSISVILGLLDDYWGQRAFVDRESRVGREDNSMTVGIVCQDDRHAGLSTYTFTYLSYSVWFATEYIGYLLPLTYISSPDLLTCTHIFVMRKGLINIYTYLHRLQLGQKWTHFDIMIQSVQCHIMEGVCPILGKKTRGIKSFLFLEASDTNIC